MTLGTPTVPTASDLFAAHVDWLGRALFWRVRLQRSPASHVLPNRDFWEAALREIGHKLLKTLVGVQGFEPWTR